MRNTTGSALAGDGITLEGVAQSVELDAAGRFPDVDRTNNLWRR